MDESGLVDPVIGLPGKTLEDGIALAIGGLTQLTAARPAVPTRSNEAAELAQSKAHSILARHGAPSEEAGPRHLPRAGTTTD